MRRDLRGGGLPTTPPFPWGFAAAVLLLTAALNVGPPDLLRLLRGALRDALSPALTLIDTTNNRLTTALRSTNQPPGDPASVDAAARIRALELETQRLRRELDLARARGARPRGTETTPLLAPQVVHARWLAGGSLEHIRASGLLSAGSRAGIAESALVLAAPGPRVDLGEDSELSPGDPVFAGRVVLGKIAEVGRFTSTLRLVTDPEFSARVRVARRTPQGLQVVAEGTLVGSSRQPGEDPVGQGARRRPSPPGAGPGSGKGDRQALCRLKHVTEPVAVGDQVYTAESDGLLRYPMFYGEISAADLPPAAAEWEVEVTPAARQWDPGDVEILRLGLVRERPLAN